MSFGAPFGGKFPEMKPVSSPPTLYTINGVGLMIYGSRDYDPGTNTHVVTLFFTFLFIPIFALKAYRVRDAENGGWYFIGKVPLSNLTRGWNCLILLGILAGSWAIWHNVRGNDPLVMAASRIAEADQLVAEGKIGAAAEKYHNVAASPLSGPHAAEAVNKLCAVFDSPLDKIESDQLLSAFNFGITSFKVRQRPENIVDIGIAQAKQRSESDAPTALKLLDLVAQVAPPNHKEVVALKKPILEKVVAREPDNIDALSDLAVVYEAEKNLKACEKLLLPKKDQLGAREGARILGLILVDKSQIEDALPLLETYTEDRLERLRAAEENQRNVVKNLQGRIVEDIKQNRAPGFDLNRFRALNDNQQAQNEMFQNYLAERFRNDPDFKLSNVSLQREGRVVPVAIDLGIAYLRRGQELADVDARRIQLEKAEKTFLRIRGAAGHTDEFRLTLGRVYYWLGKPDEGKKLFDELLKGPNIEQRLTTAIANILREVGAVAEARKLLEENFEKDGAIVARNNVARTRSLMMIDLDDRITWLEKIQDPDRHDLAQLCAARGDKALAESRDADAERELRQALAHYHAMPESTATLNNGGIAHFSLFRLTGDLKELNAGIANMEKALALQPSDSILLSNVADNMFANSIRDILGNEIDWAALRINGGMDHLNYVANDRAKMDTYRKRTETHEGMAKARSYFERLTVLSPKKAHNYAVLSSLMNFLEDRDGLKSLLARVARADLDHSDVSKRILDAFQDMNLEKLIKETEHSRDFHEKRVTDARKAGGPTLAVALGDWQRDIVRLLLLGKNDVPDLVERAEEAHKTAPSKATHRNLVDALFLRAHRELVTKDKAYAAMAKDGFRALGAGYLIAFGIDKENGPRKACLANKDVKRAMAMLKAQCDQDADEFNEWTWALFRTSDADWAAAKVKVLKNNELAQTRRELAQHLSPFSVSDAYRQYWWHQMQGNAADANAALERLTEKGIPLPK